MRKYSILKLTYLSICLLFVCIFVFYTFVPIDLYYTSQLSDGWTSSESLLHQGEISYFERFDYYFHYQISNYDILEGRYSIVVEIRTLDFSELVYQDNIDVISYRRDFVSLNVIHDLFEASPLYPKELTVNILLLPHQNIVHEDIRYYVTLSDPVPLYSIHYSIAFITYLLLAFMIPLSINHIVLKIQMRIKRRKLLSSFEEPENDIRSELVPENIEGKKTLIRKKNQEDIDEITEKAEYEVHSKSKIA